MPTQIDIMSPSSCVSYGLRRASRLSAKLYDAALKPAGLRNTQFTLLSTLVFEGPLSIGELSEALATDGTTLNRNIDVMIKYGFVENTDGGDDERVRRVQATPSGKLKYQEALPFWNMAQENMIQILGADNWARILTDLKRIE
ncbi:MAG: MarR family winged helix-turn-helix transcriptional regulator [Rhizobiaceae bacterium]